MPMIVHGSVTTDMSRTQYDGLPGINASGLKQIRRSPAHYIWNKEHPTPSTAAQQLGTAVHAAILEPLTFRRDYCRFIQDGRTKAGKAERAAAAERGMIGFKASDYDIICAMQRSVEDHRLATTLIYDTPGHEEVCATWSLDGLPCKALYDRMTNDGDIIDVKTVTDASPDAFKRQVAQYGYHMQAAWYLDGIENPDARFFFVCVEKDVPHLVAIYELCPASIDQGLRECMDAFDTYRNCMNANRWPGYPDEVRELSLPTWALDFDTLD